MTKIDSDQSLLPDGHSSCKNMTTTRSKPFYTGDITSVLRSMVVLNANRIGLEIGLLILNWDFSPLFFSFLLNISWSDSKNPVFLPIKETFMVFFSLSLPKWLCPSPVLDCFDATWGEIACLERGFTSKESPSFSNHSQYPRLSDHAAYGGCTSLFRLLCRRP